MSITEKKQQIEAKRHQIALLRDQIALLRAEINMLMSEIELERVTTSLGLLDDFRVTCVRLDNLDILGE